MVNNYKISNVSTISDYMNSVPRNVTLSVGSRSLDHISKCTERTTDLRTIENTGDKKVLNECYIDLTLSKLRELDSNSAAQDQYILSRSKFLNKDLINVLVIKLRLEGNEVLNDLDYEYLNSLLSWNRNDIYVMPMLEFEDRNRTDMVSSYDEFVKRMLEEKDSWINNNIKIGISIPHMYPRRNIERLFDRYSDADPTFVAVDFNNSRMDRPSNVTGTILKHFAKNNEENTFLYGVNVKPYKRGAENTSAWDIYMVHGAFNAIGPTHSKPRSIILPADWSNMGRMFDSDLVEYRVIDDSLRDSFIEWMKNEYRIDLDVDFKKNDKSLYPYLKRYNFQMSNGVLMDFSDAIRKNDPEKIEEMISVMPEEMKNINIMEGSKKRKRKSDLA